MDSHRPLAAADLCVVVLRVCAAVCVFIAMQKIVFLLPSAVHALAEGRYMKEAAASPSGLGGVLLDAVSASAAENPKLAGRLETAAGYAAVAGLGFSNVVPWLACRMFRRGQEGT